MAAWWWWVSTSRSRITRTTTDAGPGTLVGRGGGRPAAAAVPLHAERVAGRDHGRHAGGGRRLLRRAAWAELCGPHALAGRIPRRRSRRAHPRVTGARPDRVLRRGGAGARSARPRGRCRPPARIGCHRLEPPRFPWAGVFFCPAF